MGWNRFDFTNTSCSDNINKKREERIFLNITFYPIIQQILGNSRQTTDPVRMWAINKFSYRLKGPVRSEKIIFGKFMEHFHFSWTFRIYFFIMFFGAGPLRMKRRKSLVGSKNLQIGFHLTITIYLFGIWIKIDGKKIWSQNYWLSIFTGWEKFCVIEKAIFSNNT